MKNRFNRRDFVKMGASAALRPTLGLAALPITAEEIFSDRTKEAGIDFVHFNGASGFHYYPETMGSGVALFDYDNDGDLDIFLVQGTQLGPAEFEPDPIPSSVAAARPALPQRFGSTRRRHLHAQVR